MQQPTDVSSNPNKHQNAAPDNQQDQLQQQQLAAQMLYAAQAAAVMNGGYYYGGPGFQQIGNQMGLPYGAALFPPNAVGYYGGTASPTASAEQLNDQYQLQAAAAAMYAAQPYIPMGASFYMAQGAPPLSYDPYATIPGQPPQPQQQQQQPITNPASHQPKKPSKKKSRNCC